ncbi:hypothetical protein C1645_842544 [Glomus cerebriforme]|uniref:Uncharacterized protein n=1 Tax=Glomus cerebriforme TaxID=658196 RepID=A0A397S7L1_9GLOM|nr:hypothetical protein C1645_842544 [Glomus cerebriforme]
MEEIIEQIGPEKFSAIVSDAEANIQNAHKIITEKYPNILNLQVDYSSILPQAVLTILRSHTFFDDVRVLAFALHPIKKAILKLELQSCILANCFLELAQLEAAIKKLSEYDYFTFCR